MQILPIEKVPRFLAIGVITLGILAIVLLFSNISWLESAGRATSFVGLFLTAVFGTIGTLTEYKKDGRITDWGRTAVTGTLVSFCVAGSGELINIRKDNVAAIERAAEREMERLETERERLLAEKARLAQEQRTAELLQRAEEQSQSTREILNETKRQVTRFNRVGLGLSLKFGDGFLESDFHEEVSKRSPALGFVNTWKNGASSCAPGFPDFGLLELAPLRQMINRIDIYIAILRAPDADRIALELTDPSDWYPGLDPQSGSEIVSRLQWKFRDSGNSILFTKNLDDFASSCANTRLVEQIEMNYDGDEDNFKIRTVTPAIEYWQTAGEVVSGRDLRDKKVIVWSSLFTKEALGQFEDPSVNSLSLALPPGATQCSKVVRRIDVPSGGYFFLADMSQVEQGAWFCATNS